MNQTNLMGLLRLKVAIKITIIHITINYQAKLQLLWSNVALALTSTCHAKLPLYHQIPMPLTMTRNTREGFNYLYFVYFHMQIKDYLFSFNIMKGVTLTENSSLCLHKTKCFKLILLILHVACYMLESPTRSGDWRVNDRVPRVYRVLLSQKSCTRFHTTR